MLVRLYVVYFQCKIISELINSRLCTLVRLYGENYNWKKYQHLHSRLCTLVCLYLEIICYKYFPKSISDDSCALVRLYFVNFQCRIISEIIYSRLCTLVRLYVCTWKTTIGKKISTYVFWTLYACTFVRRNNLLQIFSQNQSLMTCTLVRLYVCKLSMQNYHF